MKNNKKRLLILVAFVLASYTSIIDAAAQKRLPVYGPRDRGRESRLAFVSAKAEELERTRDALARLDQQNRAHGEQSSVLMFLKAQVEYALTHARERENRILAARRVKFQQ